MNEPRNVVNGVVILSARTAFILERCFNFGELRGRTRGSDIAFDNDLLGLHYAANLYSASVSGRKHPQRAKAGEQSESSTRWAARRLGVTEARIRQICRAGKLRAARHGNQWLIEEADLQAYEATRGKSAA